MTAPIYIVAAQRLPVGKARGQYATLRPDDLLTQSIEATLATVPSIERRDIADVIIGCAMPEAEQGMNVARTASLMAGLPDTVPAITINRFCSSGLQAIAYAAQMIQTGNAELVMAGGVESMSCVPLGGHAFRGNVGWFDREQGAIAHSMGITAETVASTYKISRERQDEFAYASHQKALNAQAKGLFNDEMTSFEGTSEQFNWVLREQTQKTVSYIQDEGPRADTSLEKLNALRPVFSARGSVTAGNSSQTSDGAATLLLASEAYVKQHDLTPLAIFKQFTVAGVPPEVMGIGPVAAIPKCLEQAGVSQDDLAWVELNEAFAAQSLAVMDTLKMNPETVNPLGGAIALGHPLGATGAVRACTLVHGLRRERARYGMVSMCIGTGMGAAGLFEAL